MAMRKSDEELEILAHLGNCRSTGEVSLMVMGTAWKAVGSGEQLGCGSIPHFSAKPNT